MTSVEKLKEFDKAWDVIDSIDISVEFDNFNNQNNLSILSEFMTYLENKYPYTNLVLESLFDGINTEDFADYIKEKYPDLAINSYDITVYNIIKR